MQQEKAAAPATNADNTSKQPSTGRKRKGKKGTAARQQKQKQDDKQDDNADDDGDPAVDNEEDQDDDTSMT